MKYKLIENNKDLDEKLFIIDACNSRNRKYIGFLFSDPLSEYLLKDLKNSYSFKTMMKCCIHLPICQFDDIPKSRAIMYNLFFFNSDEQTQRGDNNKETEYQLFSVKLVC